MTELVKELENIVEEYKKFQKESRELLGFGHTDKRYIVQKKKLIDERLKKLKFKWIEVLTAISPDFGQLYKKLYRAQKH